MMLMQEDRELFAQRFIPLGVVASDHGILEQSLLNILWQVAPSRHHGLPKCKGKSAVIVHGPISHLLSLSQPNP
jgi:hypothetical protein